MLADEFLKNGDIYEIDIYEINVALAMSEDTITGYKGTNSVGPSQKFGSLVLCDATIIIEE